MAQTRPDSVEGSELVYSLTARAFHWVTVIAVFTQIPLGFYMVWRGNATNFDAMTNSLYSAHKLIGFGLLWFVVLRLLYRFVHGAPPDEPTLEWWHKAGAHLNHWGLYALLLVVPALGWLGVSYYGALDTPLFNLPALAAKDEAKSDLIFKLHAWGAILILAVVAVHFLAALYHYFIRGDGVLARMLPGLNKRS
jgi:cytochrome b561